MGTSSSYPGPVGRAPLLPPWAPEPENGPLPPAQPTGPEGRFPGWQPTKAALTRFVGSGGSGTTRGRRNLGRTVAGYVSSQGGSRSAAGAARAGRATTQGVANFLSDALRTGIAETTRAWGLESYVGADAGTFLAALVDALSPPGASLEDAVARHALAVTLAELFAESDNSPDDSGSAVLESLSALTPQMVGELLQRYVSRYIFTRLIEILGSRLYENAADEAIACRLERDIEDFVFGTVRLSLPADPSAVDWSGEAGRAFVERMFIEAHAYLEAIT